MLRRILYLFLFSGLIFSLASCKREKSETIYSRLELWDAQLNGHLQAVADSLATLSPGELSRGNRAYYGLLKTIADDKTYADFTSDSLINSVESYYRKNARGNNYHIRALTYQSIVRSRMGVTDSTVYQPLKEALRILHKQEEPDLTSLYFASYYMGDIHKENNNHDLSFHYFQQALTYAKLEDNPLHLFDIYLALYWNAMIQDNYIKGRQYLDTLETFSNLSPDASSFLLNAQAVYLDTQQEYRLAIEKEKEQLLLAPQIKEKPRYFKIFYSISDRYRSLNRLDSAFYYARQAIAHIEDSTYYLNYLLYENAADIASELHDYRLSDDYRRQALSTYEKSVKKRLDTRIRELEKRYDRTESENKALKAEARNRLMLAIGSIVLLSAGILTLYFAKQRSIVLLQREKLAAEKERMEAEKRRLDAEAQLLRQQTETQQQLLSHYVSFLEIYGSQLNQTRTLSKKVYSKDVKLGGEFDQMLKEGRHRFNKLAETMFTSGDISELFGIAESDGILTESDRLLLSMLAASAGSEQIAALLNTSTHNLKTRKSYLKKKIADHATADNGFERLLELF